MRSLSKSGKVFFLKKFLSKFSASIQNNPHEARNILLQNPQLAYALLQAISRVLNLYLNIFCKIFPQICNFFYGCDANSRPRGCNENVA